MQIVAAAYRHGYRDDEIMHAYNNALRYVEYEYDNEERLLILLCVREAEIVDQSTVSQRIL